MLDIMEGMAGTLIRGQVMFMVMVLYGIYPGDCNGGGYDSTQGKFGK